jgi:lauroyl/myristoyl acyltransferase
VHQAVARPRLSENPVLEVSKYGNDSYGQGTSAAKERPDAEPVASSAVEREPAERKRGNPRKRMPTEELKLDLSSRLLFYLMAGLLHLLSLLPDFILYPLGIAIGYGGYLIDRRRRKVGIRNLAIAFPERDEQERLRILRASYINHRSGAEYIRLGGFFYRRLKKRVTDNDHFDYWMSLLQDHSRKGLLVLTAHLGNFELLPASHAMYGFQIDLVHHTQRFAAGEALMTFVRERLGSE